VYVDVPSLECRRKSKHKDRKQIVSNVSRVQLFGNDSNKPQFNSGGNEEVTEFW
jgi:hypothetical protein